MNRIHRLSAAVLLGWAAIVAPHGVRADTTLLNVSYDTTRELYTDYNKAFAADWKAKTGEVVKINQSHGGSGGQARAVIDGLDADVVTLGLAADVQAIVDKAHTIAPDWQKRLPNNAAPYTSTIVFLVRKGNPKQIRDWSDLVKPGISVITPNPKTSGVARLNYLAAWNYALERNNHDEAKAKDFLIALFKNVPVLDSGGRGSTLTFTQRGIGDVLLAWENDAILAANEVGKDQYEIVEPSVSILAEPSVAVVDANVDKHKTRKIAEAYLQYLYSPAGQEIIAKHHGRPRDPAVFKRYAKDFPKIRMVTLADFGTWDTIQQKHFDDGALFDQVIGASKR